MENNNNNNNSPNNADQPPQFPNQQQQQQQQQGRFIVPQQTQQSNFLFEPQNPMTTQQHGNPVIMIPPPPPISLPPPSIAIPPPPPQQQQQGKTMTPQITQQFNMGMPPNSMMMQQNGNPMLQPPPPISPPPPPQQQQQQKQQQQQQYLNLMDMFYGNQQMLMPYNFSYNMMNQPPQMQYQAPIMPPNYHNNFTNLKETDNDKLFMNTINFPPAFQLAPPQNPLPSQQQQILENLPEGERLFKLKKEDREKYKKELDEMKDYCDKKKKEFVKLKKDAEGTETGCKQDQNKLVDAERQFYRLSCEYKARKNAFDYIMPFKPLNVERPVSEKKNNNDKEQNNNITPTITVKSKPFNIKRNDGDDDDYLIEPLQKHPKLVSKSQLNAIAKLNVGGKTFMMATSNLKDRSNTMLGFLVSGEYDTEKDDQGNTFVDRSSEMFEYVAKWLRGKYDPNEVLGKSSVKWERLYREAEYFGLDDLAYELGGVSIPTVMNIPINGRKCLTEWCSAESFELLYRGSDEMFSAEKFHQKCEGKSPTLVLVKSGDYIFGGYSQVPWSALNEPTPENGKGDEFLFSLVNKCKTGPLKFPLKNGAATECLLQCRRYGPSFGINSRRLCELHIADLANACTHSHVLGFPTKFDGCGYDKFIFADSERFQVMEYEVFLVHERTSKKEENEYTDE